MVFHHKIMIIVTVSKLNCDLAWAPRLTHQRHQFSQQSCEVNSGIYLPFIKKEARESQREVTCWIYHLLCYPPAPKHC